MRPLLGLLAVSALIGCVDEDTGTDPTDQNLLEGDDKADGSDPLWAGLTSITIERYVPDPCNDGRNGFGDQPYVYGSWARERAGIRNICFEVWKPGITDWDNPDFWRQLDVQVDYRYGSEGPFARAYVNSNGRRGNNRRYAWSLDYQLDPMVYVASVAKMKAPFRLLSEPSNGWALLESDMEVYFTVNGRALKTPQGKNYVVRYQGYVRAPELQPNPNGFVLHDIVTCEGGAVRFGSGAGYFAADMNHAKAAALVGANLIHGVGVAQSGQLVQLVYSQQDPHAGQTLPGFSSSGGLRIVPSGSQMTVEIDAYDRTANVTKVVSATFDGCVLAN